MIKNPSASLSKVYDLLKPDGNLFICVSHVAMETEVRGGHQLTPFADLPHVVRGIPLIYYTRNTFKKFLEKARFEVMDSFVAQHPDFSYEKLRQEYYVIAKKKCLDEFNSNEVVYDDLIEVEKSKKFMQNYCEIITEKSIKVFMAENNVKSIVILYDDDCYCEWLQSKFSLYKVPLKCYQYKRNSNIGSWLNGIPDSQGTFVLNATENIFDIDFLTKQKSNLKYIDCFVYNDSDNVYGKWIKSDEGKIIITKAFCPVQNYPANIFPFKRNIPVNNPRSLYYLFRYKIQPGIIKWFIKSESLEK